MEDTSTQTDATATVVDTAPQGEFAQGSWNYDAETAGVGERPVWFKEKYTTVADQAKAYGELESRFGGFTGSPEEYTVNEGVDYDADAPLFGKLQELAKSNNMSNQMFNDIITMYNDDANAYMEEAERTDFEKLGANAEARVNNVADWAKANIPADLQESFIMNARTADDIKLAEHFMNMTKTQSPANINATPSATQDTPESLRELQFALNDKGERKFHVDAAYQKMVNSRMANFYNKG